MSLLSTDTTLATLLPGNAYLATVTATGGTFTLTFNAVTTAAIAEAATAVTVQAALVALSTVGTGNVVVTGNAGGPWTVTFIGTLANTGLALSGSGALLTPGGSTLVIAQRAAVYNTVAVKPPASYLTFALIPGKGPEYAFGGVVAYEEFRYQMTCTTQGPGRATIAAVLDRLDALLSGATLVVSGRTCWGVEKASDNPGESGYDGAGALWQWGGADYVVSFGD